MVHIKVMFYWHSKKALRHYSEEEYEQHMVQFALYGSKTEALDQKQTLFIFLVTDNNFFPPLIIILIKKYSNSLTFWEIKKDSNIQYSCVDLES